jgi:hypothetical protein
LQKCCHCLTVRLAHLSRSQINFTLKISGFSPLNFLIKCLLQKILIKYSETFKTFRLNGIKFMKKSSLILFPAKTYMIPGTHLKPKLHLCPNLGVPSLVTPTLRKSNIKTVTMNHSLWLGRIDYDPLFLELLWTIGTIYGNFKMNFISSKTNRIFFECSFSLKNRHLHQYFTRRSFKFETFSQNIKVIFACWERH